MEPQPACPDRPDPREDLRGLEAHLPLCEACGDHFLQALLLAGVLRPSDLGRKYGEEGIPGGLD